jgi:hypothetical protein
MAEKLPKNVPVGDVNAGLSNGTCTDIQILKNALCHMIGWWE